MIEANLGRVDPESVQERQQGAVDLKNRVPITQPLFSFFFMARVDAIIMESRVWYVFVSTIDLCEHFGDVK